jgi:predicted GIY-YIG superfamily endonuclease
VYIKFGKRLSNHKKGRVYSTRRKLPMELIYFEAYKYRQNALEGAG